MNFRVPSLVLLAVLTLTGPSGAAIERPNIVFVLFDDFGWGQPPSNREDSAFRTPAFDRLARGGIRFTDAHSAAASCTPTRYGLLTGRYPSRIGQFGVLNTYSGPIIPKERLTVASFLKSQGYHTACIGKWHLGLSWAGDKKTRPSTPGHRDPLQGRAEYSRIRLLLRVYPCPQHRLYPGTGRCGCPCEIS